MPTSPAHEVCDHLKIATEINEAIGKLYKAARELLTAECGIDEGWDNLCSSHDALNELLDAADDLEGGDRKIKLMRNCGSLYSNLVEMMCTLIVDREAEPLDREAFIKVYDESLEEFGRFIADYPSLTEFVLSMWRSFWLLYIDYPFEASERHQQNFSDELAYFTDDLKLFFNVGHQKLPPVIMEKLMYLRVKASCAAMHVLQAKLDKQEEGRAANIADQKWFFDEAYNQFRPTWIMFTEGKRQLSNDLLSLIQRCFAKMYINLTAAPEDNNRLVDIIVDNIRCICAMPDNNELLLGWLTCLVNSVEQYQAGGEQKIELAKQICEGGLSAIPFLPDTLQASYRALFLVLKARNILHKSKGCKDAGELLKNFDKTIHEASELLKSLAEDAHQRDEVLVRVSDVVLFRSLHDPLVIDVAHVQALHANFFKSFDSYLPQLERNQQDEVLKNWLWELFNLNQALMQNKSTIHLTGEIFVLARKLINSLKSDKSDWVTVFETQIASAVKVAWVPKQIGRGGSAIGEAYSLLDIAERTIKVFSNSPERNSVLEAVVGLFFAVKLSKKLDNKFSKFAGVLLFNDSVVEYLSDKNKIFRDKFLPSLEAFIEAEVKKWIDLDRVDNKLLVSFGLRKVGQSIKLNALYKLTPFNEKWSDLVSEFSKKQLFLGRLEEVMTENELMKGVIRSPAFAADYTQLTLSVEKILGMINKIFDNSGLEIAVNAGKIDVSVSRKTSEIDWDALFNDLKRELVENSEEYRKKVFDRIYKIEKTQSGVVFCLGEEVIGPAWPHQLVGAPSSLTLSAEGFDQWYNEWLDSSVTVKSIKLKALKALVKASAENKNAKSNRKQLVCDRVNSWVTKTVSSLSDRESTMVIADGFEGGFVTLKPDAFIRAANNLLRPYGVILDERHEVILQDASLFDAKFDQGRRYDQFLEKCKQDSVEAEEERYQKRELENLQVLQEPINRSLKPFGLEFAVDKYGFLSLEISLKRGGHTAYNAIYLPRFAELSGVKKSLAKIFCQLKNNELSQSVALFILTQLAELAGAPDALNQDQLSLALNLKQATVLEAKLPANEDVLVDCVAKFFVVELRRLLRPVEPAQAAGESAAAPAASAGLSASSESSGPSRTPTPEGAEAAGFFSLSPLDGHNPYAKVFKPASPPSV